MGLCNLTDREMEYVYNQFQKMKPVIQDMHWRSLHKLEKDVGFQIVNILSSKDGGFKFDPDPKYGFGKGVVFRVNEIDERLRRKNRYKKYKQF